MTLYLLSQNSILLIAALEVDKPGLELAPIFDADICSQRISIKCHRASPEKHFHSAGVMLCKIPLPSAGSHGMTLEERPALYHIVL